MPMSYELWDFPPLIFFGINVPRTIVFYYTDFTNNVSPFAGAGPFKFGGTANHIYKLR